MAGPLKAASIKRHSVTEQVHERLKKAIIDGTLKPGERLVEGELAAMLGASRTPVREALSKLEQEGLVQPLRFGGLAVVELSEHDVSEIFGLIRVLECYAARLAAERATDAQIARMQLLCTRAAQLGEEETDRLGELNRQFHQQLVEAADHKRVRELISTLRSSMRPYRLLSLASAEFRQQTIRDHNAMLDAIRGRNPGLVEEIMRDHLTLAEQISLKHLRSGSHAALARERG